MKYKLTIKHIVILLLVSNSSFVCCQIDFDTVMLSHSPFLEYEMGFALLCTNYSSVDYKKLNRKDITNKEINQIKSKYIPEKLEFIATHEGWINPLNLYKVQFDQIEYHFTFPSSTYNLNLNQSKSDLILKSSKRATSWKFDGKSIKLILHYKDSICPVVKNYSTKIPIEFILSEQEKGLIKFDIIIENELKHQLISSFLIQ